MNLPFFNWIKNIFSFDLNVKVKPSKILIPSTMEYYDQITINRIEKLHPVIKDKLKNDYLEINNKLPKGVRLRFAQGLRTIAEQDALYAQGRSKPGKIVTNAKGGQSIHNYGLAFDIVMLYDKDNNGTFETASWERDKYWKQVESFFKSKGYTWGGDWQSFKDFPHFEKTFGYTWQDLIKKKVDSNGYVILS